MGSGLEPPLEPISEPTPVPRLELTYSLFPNRVVLHSLMSESFRSINREEFLKLDPSTKDAAARARHLGIIRNSESQMVELLLDAMLKPRSDRPPYRHDEIVVVLMHRDDMITPPELKRSLELQGLEVGIFVTERSEFSNALMVFTACQCVNKECRQWFAELGEACPHCNEPFSKSARVVKPYVHAGETIKRAAPPQTIFVAVFDLNVCTVTYLGFDPNRIGEDVPADPNYPPPPSVVPLPPSEPTKALEKPEGT